MLTAAIFKLIFILTLILISCPIQMFLRLVNSSYRYVLPVLFHKLIIFILGIKIMKIGEISKSRPLLLLGNHSSYLDILVLGSVLPVCFIAKAEISRWPFFGWLAKLQDSIFIERKSIRTVSNMREVISKLNNNFSIALFPEGTTSDGSRVLPFKSAFFSMLENKDKDIDSLDFQSFSICYTNINNLPIDRRSRPFVSWFGDMNLVSHFLQLLKLNSINVTLLFHPIFSVEGMNRKSIASLAYSQVSIGLAKVLSGRESKVKKYMMNNNTDIKRDTSNV